MFHCGKYNFNSSAPFQTELQLELFCYRHHAEIIASGGTPLPRARHFRNIVELQWGPDNTICHFVWNPWAEKMNEVSHRHKYPGFSGCASSGKSDWGAIYGIVNWQCDPAETFVLVTTTGLKDAQRRIWGAVEKYFLAATSLPGRLVSSKYQIDSVDEEGKKLPKCGIQLVAGDQKKRRDLMKSLIGTKGKRVFLIADELPELSEALVTTAVGNLESNPYFQMMGIGNFKGRDDPFGKFVEPKNGWESINVESEEWETKRGYCARFDGVKSPNVAAGFKKYPGIYDTETLAKHRDQLGEDTAEFWRMCRSFEAVTGDPDCIYSESDFLSGMAYDVVGRDVPWADRQTRVSSLDPGFTNGGDRSVQWFGWWGQMKGGLWVLCLDKMLLLRENVTLSHMTRTRQIAEQFVTNCIEEGVSPLHAALDATGPGGIAIADFIIEVWNKRIKDNPQLGGDAFQLLRIDFSGAPSSAYVGAVGDKTGKMAYDRRVSELWGIGVEFLKYGQLKGITSELAKQMKGRRKDTVKGPDGLKMRAETKQKMKERIGYSPDEADSFFVLLATCRERLKAVAGAPVSVYAQANADWNEQCKRANAIYANGNHLKDYARQS